MLADLILVIHFAFVLFVAGGLPLVWVGAALDWRWVRNRRLRLAHLAAIVYVAAEAVIGVLCPLTVWEDALRGVREEKSFVARWLHRLMYYEWPEWVFTTLYVTFALAVVATWWLVPPDRRGRGQA
jgi:hypothetical protein